MTTHCPIVISDFKCFLDYTLQNTEQHSYAIFEWQQNRFSLFSNTFSVCKSGNFYFKNNLNFQFELDTQKLQRQIVFRSTNINEGF